VIEDLDVNLIRLLAGGTFQISVTVRLFALNVPCRGLSAITAVNRNADDLD
jgi:hypothetical protein